MDNSTLGIVIGGIIPAFLFGGFGVMQKTCMRAGLGTGGFFLVFGATVVCGGLPVRVLMPGGAGSPEAVLLAVGYALLWSMGTLLILLAVDRLGASISQLTPLYNTSTLIAVLLGLWIFAEWKYVRVIPLLLGTVSVVVGAVLVANASREESLDGNRSKPASQSANRYAMLVGGLLPAVLLGLVGPLMKGAMGKGLGVGDFLLLFGTTMMGVGLVCRPWRSISRFPISAIASGIITGLLWVVGTSLVLLALGPLKANISQLTPLFNMNTLVVVLLGLWLFKEHRHVQPAIVVAGAALVILGGVLVAGA